jgi:hypothetical protein
MLSQLPAFMLPNVYILARLGLLLERVVPSTA